MKQDHVIVVGGGHAGTEAAATAARMGCQTTLITPDAKKIGVMSCNPAMGGLGKGHLIREIDALGGLMGVCSDQAGIQYRLLNRRKGPAVQGPRAQIDRELYRKAIQNALFDQPNLQIIEGMVVDVTLTNDHISGVILEDGRQISAGAVILTTGTFLKGTIHIGEEKRSAGRNGDAASVALADRLYALDLPMGRLKTGTPPRLDGRTIDWESLESQPGDEDPTMLSFLFESPSVAQVSCGITHTNPETHDIIRENLSRSAMYSGTISGKGPRYCPSIEDKIARFGDKDSHQIFLEPEGLDDQTVYPNGISTSLPLEVQNDYVHSIRGLENTEILQYGYAIEYDYVDPRSLDSTLQVRSLPNLYLAGQINGTTGYEEAGAQGLFAAINAVRKIRGDDHITLSRSDSYIGVMVDDLISRGVTEPYRMFTSRAEFRLSLRADNADQRLTPLGVSLGLVSDERRTAFDNKKSKIDALTSVLRNSTHSSSELRAAGIMLSADGKRRSGYDILAIPDVGISDLASLIPSIGTHDRVTKDQVAREALYAKYYERQKRDAELVRQEEETRIPEDFDYATVHGLSGELREKLRLHQPRSVAAASRIESVTPAALNAVILKLKTLRSKNAS